MKTCAISIAKNERDTTNEDAVLHLNDCIAVSDGAGGGGLFAERWSRYLLKHLPAHPILSFESLNQWIESIWEPYYDDCEADAKQKGGLFLSKFYDEGSFATLAAAWQIDADTWQWMAYGDSVAFHYNTATGLLEHSFTCLADFSRPPYLINCKDELSPDGFRSGQFHTDRHSVLFIASDALSHYLLGLYDSACRRNVAASADLLAAMSAHDKNALLTHTLAGIFINRKGFARTLRKLTEKTAAAEKFRSHVYRLERENKLAHDDYSLAVAHNFQTK